VLLIAEENCIVRRTGTVNKSESPTGKALRHIYSPSRPTRSTLTEGSGLDEK
jgi:hypothetical protein